MLNQGSCKHRLGRAFHVLQAMEARPDIAVRLGLQDGEAELVRGWALYRAAHEAALLQLRRLGEAAGAGARCSAAFAAARVAQARLTALARVMITDPADRDRLGLSGRRAEGLGAWTVQAGLFHANLNEADRARLVRVGVHTAELEGAAAKMAVLGPLHAACVAAKAAVKAATAAKTAAFEALAAFISVIMALARVVEPEDPHVVAQLGMRADQRRRRRRAPAGSMGSAGAEAATAVASDAGQAGASGRVSLSAADGIMAERPVRMADGRVERRGNRRNKRSDRKPRRRRGRASAKGSWSKGGDQY